MKGFGVTTQNNNKRYKNKGNKLSKVEILNKGLNFHRLNKLDQAEKYYQLYIDLGYEDARIFSNYGVICEKRGDLKKAIILLKKANSISPNNPTINSNIGNVLRKQKKTKEAEKYYRNAILINPNYFEANSNLGSILIEMGETKEAERFISKALEINPMFAIGYTNLGHIQKEYGKYKDSISYHYKAIEIDPNLAIAYCNIAVTYRDMGQYDKAYSYIEKAIKIQPNFAEAYINKGNIQKDLGNYKEAELSIKKAIEINPDEPSYYSILGILYREIGNLKSALNACEKAMKINPSLDIVNITIGRIYQDLGNHKGAFNAYFNVIDKNETKAYNFSPILGLLKEIDLYQIERSKIKFLFNKLLDRNDVKHNELFKVFNFIFKEKIFYKSREKDQYLLKDNYLKIIIKNTTIIKALKIIIFTDINWEYLIRNIRKEYCISISNENKILSLQEKKLLLAISEQCFMNEYIYFKSEKEDESLEKILNRNQSRIYDPIDIILLTCYRPLYEILNDCKCIDNIKLIDSSISEIYKQQLEEIIKEKKLSKSIKTIGIIDDKVSVDIKNQYENNPYPRWRYGNSNKGLKLSVNTIINEEIRPNRLKIKQGSQPLDILIAGCGTGNQILETQRFNNSNIKAIDLSNASLSYAKRKLIEQEIKNVELIQMDILDIGLLKKEFDIIECGGVLHHMDKPFEGLKILTNSLKNGGLMKLGLYSELARKEIIKIRDLISKENIVYSKSNIIEFRERIISKKIINKYNLNKSPDFYTLSSFVDLCFNMKEYRFSIQEIKNSLIKNNLEFLGFYCDKNIKSLYSGIFPEDEKQINLDNWERFEHIYPNTFSRMYQFWVKKKSNTKQIVS